MRIRVRSELQNVIVMPSFQNSHSLAKHMKLGLIRYGLLFTKTKRGKLPDNALRRGTA